MSTRILLAIVVGAITLLSACKKDEIDLATLNTNPFDADYAGAPLFTFLSSETVVVVVNGTPQRNLNAQVRVNTELFGRATTYQVGVDQESGSGIPSNAIPNGLLTISRGNVQPGQEVCWSLRVGNGGAYGGGNRVCATAE